MKFDPKRHSISTIAIFRAWGDGAAIKACRQRLKKKSYLDSVVLDQNVLIAGRDHAMKVVVGFELKPCRASAGKGRTCWMPATEPDGRCTRHTEKK